MDKVLMVLLIHPYRVTLVLVLKVCFNRNWIGVVHHQGIHQGVALVWRNKGILYSKITGLLVFGWCKK